MSFFQVLDSLEGDEIWRQCVCLRSFRHSAYVIDNLIFPQSTRRAEALTTRLRTRNAYESIPSCFSREWSHHCHNCLCSRTRTRRLAPPSLRLLHQRSVLPSALRNCLRRTDTTSFLAVKARSEQYAGDKWTGRRPMKRA
jgi:hypothetical protein